jgi:divalent metal cation (Fe/Co/Zn/Cd) transporter
MIKTIIDIIKEHSEILSYHKLRTRKSGNIREIDIHLMVNKENSLTDVHNLCYDIENHIKNALPGSYVTIHIEPKEE